MPPAPLPRDGMIFRFSLYGFLKNQRYYEPFLFLAFLEKGLSFFQIGILIAFREVCMNLVEIPSGAVADVWGRRRAMVLSFAAFIVSFVAFGLSTTYWHFFGAMFLFAVGDAFRTGTHKAMIFEWVDRHGLADEKTRIYGITRSYSKLGSALSVVIVAITVFVTQRYTYIFWMCIPPYAIGLMNFLGYPAYLDATARKRLSVGEVWRTFGSAMKNVFGRGPLRGLVMESLCFEGTFKGLKDYLQPLLKGAALAIPALTAVSVEQRTAVLVGVVFFVLYLGSSVASRKAHRVVDRFGDEARAAGVVWLGALAGYALLGATMLLSALAGDAWATFAWLVAGMVVYLGLYIVQNLWRPIMVARFNVYADKDESATVLSIESQAKTWATMVIAPGVGLAVDAAGGALWPVGVAGVVMAMLGIVAHRVSSAPSPKRRAVDVGEPAG